MLCLFCRLLIPVLGLCFCLAREKWVCSYKFLSETFLGQRYNPCYFHFARQTKAMHVDKKCYESTGMKSQYNIVLGFGSAVIVVQSIKKRVPVMPADPFSVSLTFHRAIPADKLGPKFQSLQSNKHTSDKIIHFTQYDDAEDVLFVNKFQAFLGEGYSLVNLEFGFTKEEIEEMIDNKMKEIRRKNRAIEKRHEEIQKDKEEAEKQGAATQTPRGVQRDEQKKLRGVGRGKRRC
ncbi:hypothetical protein CAPTEDRAFT_209115 [Capitella teleta]|uniref:Uncharacterized protein n=1 Tax=Capitella teleta TaxID=283909 RepID=R7UKJ0_CAPTE|nr:hypothetical protein CAPTEDRAFT_209115 [Capitella teleta]|eukprot:ELU06740.1 hypothetical protein CAPTEDRAFT_209115 [Capitella teleta]